MNSPHSHFFGENPRLHYLEWNVRGSVTAILMHGISANAWWWGQVIAGLSPKLRVLALDLRGHGDSEWVRPPAYLPDDHARDLERFIRGCELERPIVIGHSMGGLCALAFADLYPELMRGLIVIDIAITSSDARDRFLRRLRALPSISYPDLATAKARFRLIPAEAEVALEILNAIAGKSLMRTADGGYTLKFDRENFFGGDGMDVLATIGRLRVPAMMVRGEHSRIMTAEASARALGANPHMRLEVIPGAHHHVLLDRPALLSETINKFIDELERDK
ncbi:MAG: alpha/beta fold hydrolase [Candidatus Binataceae bacterium]